MKCACLIVLTDRLDKLRVVGVAVLPSFTTKRGKSIRKAATEALRPMGKAFRQIVVTVVVDFVVITSDVVTGVGVPQHRVAFASSIARTARVNSIGKRYRGALWLVDKAIEYVISDLSLSLMT